MLKVKEVAERLNVTPGTVRNLIKNRDIKAVKVGRNYRIESKDLDMYIDKIKGGNNNE